MINRTGLYVLKQDVKCKTSDSRWTVKEGTQIEVTNIWADRGMFYSYALGGWQDTSIKAELIIPYHSDKLTIRKSKDGEGYYLSEEDCTCLGDNIYRGKALTRIHQYEQFFALEPFELHMLFQKMKQELNALREEKRQFCEARRYGYHPMPSPEVIKELKESFPVGCRVIVRHVSDPNIYISPDCLATVHGVDSGGLVHVTCDDGTAIKLIFRADRFERVNSISGIPEGEVLKKRIGNGLLCASVIDDDAYPGIDIEYIPDEEPDGAVSLPRVLVEWPEKEKLRALIWNNPSEEDYTQKVILSEKRRNI